MLNPTVASLLRSACASRLPERLRQPALYLGLLALLSAVAAPAKAEWKYQISYKGSSTVSVGPNQGLLSLASGLGGISAGSPARPPSTTIQLNTVQGPPAQGMNAQVTINGGASTSHSNGNMQAQSYATGQIVVYVYWVPKNNDLANDPAPRKVSLSYRASRVFASTNVVVSHRPGNTGETATAIASATLNGITASPDTSSATHPGDGDYNLSPNDSDTQSQPKPIPPFGITYGPKMAVHVQPVDENTHDATFEIEFNYHIKCTCGGLSPIDGAAVNDASAGVEMVLDVSLNAADDPRGVGDNAPHASDPSYTRWMPLAFSPQLTSQPFRTGPAAPIQGPWGNMSCMYSMTFQKDKNKDQSGARLFYNDYANDSGLRLPWSLSSASEVAYDAHGDPFSTQPTYVVIDAGGDRLSFGLGMVPFKDVQSTPYATSDAGGNLFFTLKDAGPPGALKQKGPYTYTFEMISAGTPDAIARLVQIKDDLNNTQTINWGTGSFTPAMTVTDSSSGRKLNFNKASGNDYFDQVDATFVGTNNPAVRTKLTYDGSGHLTRLQVTDGVSGTPIRTDDFGYDGDNINYTAQNGVKTYTAFVEAPSKDPWGRAIKRVQSQTLGTSNDTTSSDDGNSVQGTYSYTYGAITTARTMASFGVEGRTNTTTDPRGNTVTTIDYYGDVLENSQVILPPFSGADYTGTAGNIWKTFYVPDVAKPTSIVSYDPLQRPWTTNLDSLGNVTSTRNPLNYGPSMVWGGSTGHELQSVTDATGVSASFGYTATGGRLTSVTDAAQTQQTSIIHNSYGQAASITTPRGTSTYNYDAGTGDVLRTQAPDGSVTMVGQWDVGTHSLVAGSAYSPLGDALAYTVFPDTGNPLTSTTPLQMVLHWNAAQAVDGIVHPNGLQQQNDYNNGQPTETRLLSPQSIVLAKTTRFFDSRGRVYQTADLLGTVGQYKYDKSGNVTRVIDGRNNQVAYAYGPNNELTGVSSGSLTSGYAYDAVGRLRQSTDARGVVTVYSYDNADRLQSVTLPSVPTDGFTYTYDNAGRPLAVTRANGNVVSYEYNHANKWLTAVVTQVGSRIHRIDYTYYSDGLRQTMESRVNGVLKHRETYGYDTMGRLYTQTVDGFGTTTWQYDYLGRMTQQLTAAQGGSTVGTQYEYGISGMSGDPSIAPTYLRHIRPIVGGSVGTGYELTHDYLGRLTGVTSSTSAAAYAYDLRGRLTGETRSLVVNGTTYSGTSTYSYDASNNLNGGTNGWSYNNLNQLTGAPAVGGMPGATGITYGTGGFLSGMNGRTFQYNGWGQLTQITLPSTSGGTGARAGGGGSDAGGSGGTDPGTGGGGTTPPGGGGTTPPGGGTGGGGTVTIIYDPVGRVWSVTDKNGVTRNYEYDGTTLVGEQSSASGVGYRSYVNGADGYIGDTSGGSAKYYTWDAGGNLTGVYDAQMSPLWIKSNGMDTNGNPQEGPGGSSGYYANAPPTPMTGDGAYRDPATGYRMPANGGLGSPYDENTGDALDALGQSESGAAFLRGAARYGWKETTSNPQWQPGSDERRFESQMMQMLGVPGMLYTGYTVATGWDPIAGECLSTRDRVLGGLFLGLEGAGRLAHGASAGRGGRGGGGDITGSGLGGGIHKPPGTIRPGGAGFESQFKAHFLSKRKIVESTFKVKLRDFSKGGPDDLADVLNQAIRDGVLVYDGMHSFQAETQGYLYRSKDLGVMVWQRLNGQFWTIWEEGKGAALKKLEPGNPDVW